MVRTVQTLLHSQLASNEMQALARTCGRRAADSMIENVGSSQVIIPHRVIQLILGLRDKAAPPTSQQRYGLLWRGTEGSTAETARKRPQRLWTAARTMEVLRRCPLPIAQRLVHCGIAVSTAVLSHKDNVHCTAVDEQLGQLKVKADQLS